MNIIITILFVAVIILLLRVKSALVAIQAALHDLHDDNPITAPEEKVLPPYQPPPPTPEQAIEGVLKAIRDAEAATISNIPVMCYSGQALSNLQSAASECDALKALLQQRINASIA